MKLLDYIMTLLYWFCTGAFWVGYGQGLIELWFPIFVTVCALMRSVACYVVIAEVKDGREDYY